MKKLILFTVAIIIVLSLSAQKRWGETPEDSLKCLTNYSLFREFVKQGNYKDALKPWREVYNHCPQATKYAYIDGVKIMEALMQIDKVNKDKYVDTIMMIYDKRIQYFGEEGKARGRKGSDIFQYRSNDLTGAYNELKKSFELLGNESEAGVLALYYQVLYEMYNNKQKTKEEVLEQYSPVMDATEYNISNAGKESTKEMYEKAKNNVNEIFVKIAQCSDLITLYKAKFEANPQDIELLKVIVKLLSKVDCANEKLYKDVAVALYKLEPSCEAAMANGDMFAKDDNCGKAIEFYKEASERCEDNENKTDSYIKLAKCYIRMKQPSSARMYAQKVLSINPNYGEAYIVIGDAYATSATECGDNDCTNNAAYWAAVDKYVKAKSVDNSVAEIANQKIATYTKYFPKKTDCFFYSINEGDSYTVGCWINETTVVRVQ